MVKVLKHITIYILAKFVCSEHHNRYWEWGYFEVSLSLTKKERKLLHDKFVKKKEINIYKALVVEIIK